MNKESIRKWLKSSPRLKKLLDSLIMNKVQARPRLYIRIFAAMYQHRGKHSIIYKSVRMDTPPYRKLSLGDYSIIESYCCINNSVGDVIIGDHTRIGIGNIIIGPVTIGNNVNLAQNITVTALNHNYSDPDVLIDKQGFTISAITISDDVWIGANAVILPGVTIGRHSVIAAGAVVTKDVLPNSLVAGVPAVIKKRI
ncbi:acyltransferase [Xylanibacter oryzae]|uniref:acyltransferase n=1 Tax=Xylanibacter oryzae TaxID=185293 RepID=UPI000560E191|nr:acyltransferase [Xylanibacter oryzae]